MFELLDSGLIPESVPGDDLMRVGIIVEGDAEYYSLPDLLRKMRQDCGCDIITRPALAKVRSSRCHSRSGS